MTVNDLLGARGPVAFRLAAAVVVGLGTGFAVAASHRPYYAPAAGWIAAGLVYLLWTWAVTWPMDPEETRQHALFYERDGTRHLAHLIIAIASLISLAGVAYLFHATSGDKPDVAAGLVGVLSVVVSWVVFPTIYTLRYARLYYNAPDPQNPGMDFEGGPPSYLDFAYVAFTIGMCFSVPDNGLSSRKLRKSVLSQGVLSYLFGTIIIATTMNLVSGLTG